MKIPNYMFSSLGVALGGLLNGLDTGCIGPITTMPEFEAVMGKLSPGLLGFTVSLIMLTGAVPSVFAGYFADKLGRLKVIGVGATLFLVGAILQGASSKLATFLCGRAIAGLGEGVFLSNITVYISEIAPSVRRGPLASMPQFLATTGVCLGYFICYGTTLVTNQFSWRAPYIVQSAVAVMLMACCIVLPESPRWLVGKGRKEEAIASIKKLGVSMAEAEHDFLGSQNQEATSLSLWHSFSLLFRRGYRARTILALFLLGMVQLSGIDGVLYYAPILFAQAGLPSTTSSFLASGLSAILMLLISIPAWLLADKWNRRTSAISGGLGLSFCMLTIGTLYASNAVHPQGAARWVVIILVFVFGMTFCATWAIVGKIYASEIQPANTRAAANCVAVGLGFFTNFLVAILTPLFLAKSAFGAYFLFGFLALGTVSVLAAYMPETRGRSLENIQEAFHRPVAAGWPSQLRKRFTKSRSSGTREEDSMELRNHATLSTTAINRIS
ncbi:general substrate transporter [Microthyrium microscopicum]|uniref:General substrate transporter n=1 Tax=Microthyrium microscopicum TaxID=703497 RepID=A0A6A6U015_9PEZI|nr:general substrate transporter [Microthyrium microscopicum]